MAIFCGQCGTKLVDEALFCIKCGAKQDDDGENGVAEIKFELYNGRENVLKLHSTRLALYNLLV